MQTSTTKKFIPAVMAILLYSAEYAAAETYNIKFDAFGIFSSNNEPAPNIDLHGEFLLKTDEIIPENPNLSISSASLTIAGHIYKPDEISAYVTEDGYFLGGTFLGAQSMEPGTNDFWLNISHIHPTLGYTTTSNNETWNSSKLKYSVSQVPELNSLFMLLTGISVILFAHPKRRQYLDSKCASGISNQRKRLVL